MKYTLFINGRARCTFSHFTSCTAIYWKLYEQHLVHHGREPMILEYNRAGRSVWFKLTDDTANPGLDYLSRARWLQV